ncbi:MULTISPECIES: hypothetical protein [Vibrio harveyi group]|uniref:hypothetical protein n=1 Tax=Vibrio harveyi group TaxID=717610 RepID=UPI001BD62A3D|nr:hypothetical protein [Vibrio alginolyticus]MBT0096446.1 hypothetical protein [Vibrio alginolyticus]
MDLDRLKDLLCEANERSKEPLAWRDDSSFSRWKDKVTTVLKAQLGEKNDDVIRWEKRKFGPMVIFSSTDQSSKDRIFIAAVNQAVSQLSDIVEELELGR